jgi:hypothetical protein
VQLSGKIFLAKRSVWVLRNPFINPIVNPILVARRRSGIKELWMRLQIYKYMYVRYAHT